MNKFKNRKKRKIRIPGSRREELTEEQRKEIAEHLSEEMEKQRKRIMNLHVPRPGRRH